MAVKVEFLLRLENLSQFIQVRGLSIRHQFVNEKETFEYLFMNKQAWKVQ